MPDRKGDKDVSCGIRCYCCIDLAIFTDWCTGMSSLGAFVVAGTSSTAAHEGQHSPKNEHDCSKHGADCDDGDLPRHKPCADSQQICHMYKAWEQLKHRSTLFKRYSTLGCME